LRAAFFKRCRNCIQERHVGAWPLLDKKKDFRKGGVDISVSVGLLRRGATSKKEQIRKLEGRLLLVKKGAVKKAGGGSKRTRQLEAMLGDLLKKKKLKMSGAQDNWTPVQGGKKAGGEGHPAKVKEKDLRDKQEKSVSQADQESWWVGAFL